MFILLKIVVTDNYTNFKTLFDAPVENNKCFTWMARPQPCWFCFKIIRIV